MHPLKMASGEFSYKEENLSSDNISKDLGGEKLTKKSHNLKKMSWCCTLYIYNFELVFLVLGVGVTS